VFKIQKDSPENRWFHVKSTVIPAGYESRSTQPSKLFNGRHHDVLVKYME